MARQAINKSTEAAKADGIHTLTAIKVHEVSIVDNAANRTKFLVTKATDGETPAETSARVAAKNKARAATSPTAALDAAEALAKTAASPEPVLAPVLAPVALAAPVALDPVAGIAALAKTLEINAAPQLDGSVSVTVSEVAVVPTSSAPVAVQEKAKLAVMAGIDAISERLTKLRSDVENSKGTWSNSGVPDELYGIWYIRDMITALYDIGGPAWEIEVAGDEANDSDVTKAHKAINMARVGKLLATHKALKYVTKDIGDMLKDLNSGKVDPPSEQETDTSTNKNAAPAAIIAAAPVAAPTIVAPVIVVEEKDIFKDARFVAIQEAAARSEAVVKALQKMVADQSAIIEKARQSVAPSNALLQNPIHKDTNSGTVWSADLAADKRRPSPRQ